MNKTMTKGADHLLRLGIWYRVNPAHFSAAIERRGITQEALAEAMGVSAPTMSRWRNDHGPLQGYQALRLAGLLGAKFSVLVRAA